MKEHDNAIISSFSTLAPIYGCKKIYLIPDFSLTVQNQNQISFRDVEDPYLKEIQHPSTNFIVAKVSILFKTKTFIKNQIPFRDVKSPIL